MRQDLFNKIIRLRSIMLLGFFALCMPQIVSAQNTSNKGKDFWLGYGIHVGDGSQKMILYITSDVSTQGKIEVPGLSYSASFSVTANSITNVTVPQSAFLKSAGKFKLGIHITAEKPIVVYAHIYDQKVSGASLILPVTALGKEYYSINYKQVSNEDKSNSYFFVVATEDNTEVEIIPSAKTSDGKAAGIPFRVSLTKGEVYQVLGSATSKEDAGLNQTNYFGTDLTGSKISSISIGTESCKRIAVFSGSSKIGIGCRPGGIGSSDNLYQQVYPTATWGKKFIAVPLASRDYDIIRILKSDPSATVKLNGQTLAATDFTNNFYYEFSTQNVNTIEADKPIQVVQYAVSMSQGFNCSTLIENDGDPEMIFLNPLEQNIDDITVYSPSAYDIRLHYINVVLKTEAVASFQMDKTKQEQYFKKVPGNEEYSYAQLPLPSAGVHHLEADEGFNAIAYGFGNAESYGYSAGTNLKGIKIYVQDKSSKRQITTGCAGANLGFRIDLVYPVSRISWDFKNGNAPVIKNNVQADSTYVLNGLTYYVYKLNEDIVFAENKDYQIEIKVDKIFADGCGNSELIPFDFSVYSSPSPDFKASVSCEDDSVQFTDKTDNKDRPIKAWHWDFGDGSFSEEQSPAHIYTEGKDFTATLTVSNNTGCNPVSVSKTVHVNKKPLPDFRFTGTCLSEKFVFEDKSASAEGVLVNWIWDMGDGTVLTKSSPVSFEYNYQSAGEYRVKLRISDSFGCSEVKERKLIVYPIPVADFTLPKACTEDAYAEFINTSSISGTTSSLSYSWSFGDPAAGVGNLNTSTEKNPRHIYKIAGTYTVTLVVSSEKGCTKSITKVLTINGSNPVASFSLKSPGIQCSNDSVKFVNNAYVNGNITKIDWYFDWGNAPSLKITDDNPFPGKVYSFQYPVFHEGPDRIISVRQVAYSGTVCWGEKIDQIVLKPSTEVDFELPDEICLEVPSLQLTGHELYGFSGHGYFSGDGISPNGLFKPALAGPGEHIITYTFEADNGCPESISKKIIVIPTPVINAGEDKVIIAFGETVLKTTVNEPVASYKWTPSTGLSSDKVASPVASPLSNITYTVTVVTKKGCTSSDKVNVEVLGAPEIPNTFSPNIDGVNDFWEIKHLESLPNCTMNVFNRLGQSVFQSKRYDIFWNGKYKNQNLPDGVYFYVLDPGNGRKPIAGSVTILR